MRVDINHLMTKGDTRKLALKITCYVHAMMVQKKPVDRVVVTPQQYDTLKKLASRHGDRVVLCCGDAIVYHNHDPIDESAPEYKPKPRFDAGLSPVSANPFGIEAPMKIKAEPEPIDNKPWGWTDDWPDDDIPF